jgi:hypothetical protein
MVAAFRGDRNGPRPVWEQVPHLCQVAGSGRPHIVVAENDLQDCVGRPTILDRRGLLVATEEHWCGDADGLSVAIGELLGVRGGEGWGRLARTFDRVTRAFFRDASDYAAFISFETCRDRLPRQSPALIRSPVGKPIAYARPDPARFRGSFEFDSVRLPQRLLTFASRDRRGGRRIRLVQAEQKRALGRDVGAALFSTWCLADLGEDAKDLSGFRVPAGMTCEVAPGVNGARMVNWIKMIDRTGWLSSFSVEVHPGSGELLSIRTSQMSLRFLMEMHPRWHGWFEQAVL